MSHRHTYIIVESRFNKNSVFVVPFGEKLKQCVVSGKRERDAAFSISSTQSLSWLPFSFVCSYLHCLQNGSHVTGFNFHCVCLVVEMWQLAFMSTSHLSI